MNTFPPKPGTVAYRVLAHLEAILPRRPRATVGMIAGELRGLTPPQVREACEDAHLAGYLNRSHEVSATGRGPVFYELVRGTTGELALSVARPVEEPEPVAEHIPTGTALPPGGVIEPVVDPHPPVVDAPPAALAQVVNIRRVAPSEAADVDLPPLSDWLRAAHGVPLERGGAVAPGAVAAEPEPRHVHIPAVSLSFDLANDPLPAATETPPQVTVALDFAPGPDQFAVALSSDGRLHCWRGVVPYVFSRDEARALVAYLNRVDLDDLLAEAP
jgi:hypothetical protein